MALALTPPRRWGGRRAGAGRKPSGDRSGLPHTTRPVHRAAHPAHVTLRVRPGLPSLRLAPLVRAFERSMVRGCERGDFRVAHYSLQANHVHLIVEATDHAALARGMIAVGSRLARAVNRVFRRSGPVLADRYHARALKTPREVRNALRYVLLNARRHARRLCGAAQLDPACSARWFDGWRQDGQAVRDVAAGILERPVAQARTWLLGTGWLRRHGPIDPDDVPGG
jgi:REP element-mobilizing transposase RayT